MKEGSNNWHVTFILAKTFFIFIHNISILQRAPKDLFVMFAFENNMFFKINKALAIITYCVCRLVLFSLESLGFSNSLIQQRAAKVSFVLFIFEDSDF